MIDRTWFDAIPHLHRQYRKEMAVIGLAWGLFGVAATVAWALVWRFILT